MDRKRIMAFLVALMFLTGWATAVAAQSARTPDRSSRRGGGLSIAAESQSRKGVSMVSRIDVASRRLIVDDETYRVDDQTRIRNWNGQAVTLGSIRTPKPKRGELVPITEVDFIRFEATQRRGGWYMVSIVVLEEPVQ